MIFQSLAAAFRRGKLEFRPADGVFALEPNLEMLPNIIKAYEYALERHPIESVRAAYAYFLAEAVLILHSHSRPEDARRTFELLHSRFPSRETAEGFDSFVSPATRAAEGSIP
jgi:hypothetical protein